MTKINEEQACMTAVESQAGQGGKNFEVWQAWVWILHLPCLRLGFPEAGLEMKICVCGRGRNFPLPFIVLSAGLIIKSMWDRFTRENNQI